MATYFSHGKLLISGEYVVLDGATAFALPTRFGQSLQVERISEPVIQWTSTTADGETWFEHTFLKSDILVGIEPEQRFEESLEQVGNRLFSILRSAARMNSEPFSEDSGFRIKAEVDFPLEWGLGTSSTLIANLSEWLSIDAFELLERTFGGSGYDVAVALKGSPITYQIKKEEKRNVLLASFDPDFKNKIWFIHLNRKQNSRESIKKYRERQQEILSNAVEKISAISYRIINSSTLNEFDLLLEIHENIISQVTGLEKVKNRLFPDFPGGIKSLGGWGGDFIMATGDEQNMEYFRRKGYSTILNYREIILQP